MGIRCGITASMRQGLIPIGSTQSPGLNPPISSLPRPHLQKVASWEALVQRQEACGGAPGVRHQGGELGVQVCAEPVGRLQGVQQLLAGGAAQGAGLNLHGGGGSRGGLDCTHGR